MASKTQYALCNEYTDATIDAPAGPYFGSKRAALKAARQCARVAAAITANVCVWDMKADACIATFSTGRTVGA